MSPMAPNGSTGCAAAMAMTRKSMFHALVRRYFHGALKPPFNAEKRAEAGLPPDFYWPLAEGLGQDRRRTARPASADRQDLAESRSAARRRFPGQVQNSCGRGTPWLIRVNPCGCAVRAPSIGPARRQRTDNRPVLTRIAFRINTQLERYFPEQRLFLKSDDDDPLHPPAPGDPGRWRWWSARWVWPGPSSPPR